MVCAIMAKTAYAAFEALDAKLAVTSNPYCPAGLFAPFSQVLVFKEKSHLIIFGAIWLYGAQKTHLWKARLHLKNNKVTLHCCDSPSKHCAIRDIRASPPCSVEGSWQALWRGVGEKSAPPLSNPAALIARALQTSGFTHYARGWALLLLRPHFGPSSTCDPVNCATFGNHVIFLTFFWE